MASEIIKMLMATTASNSGIPWEDFSYAVKALQASFKMVRGVHVNDSEE